jgi:pimeloyl-ACP methyl ester carboxylesterase
MSSPLLLTLPSGRTLCYRILGVASSPPIFFLHGNLNSRLFAPSWGSTADDVAAASAKVIFVDRPGVGGSSPHPARSYLSFSEDLQSLAAHLELPEFSVVGYSSGGPHALACSRLPGCRSVGLVSAVSAPELYPETPATLPQVPPKFLTLRRTRNTRTWAAI